MPSHTKFFSRLSYNGTGVMRSPERSEGFGRSDSVAAYPPVK